MLYRRNPDVEAAPMLDETIVYQPTIKKFCVLNQTAAFVWEQIDKPASVNQLAEAVSTHFDGVSLQDAARDVETVLADFTALELVLTEA